MAVGETATSSRAAPLERSDAGPRVGVLGHYGNRNLGDEAIIEALIARIRAEWPGARVIAFSMDPADTTCRHAVPAFPIRLESGRLNLDQKAAAVAQVLRNAQARAAGESPPPTVRSRLDRISEFVPKGRLRSHAGKLLRRVAYVLAEIGFVARSFWRVRALDAVFVAGSNQFLDNFGGPWGFPYTLLKWTVLCRLARCRVYHVSVGAGPLEAPLSWKLARLALRLSDYASFRDPGSRALIARVGAASDGPTVPDLAHGLSWRTSAPSAVGAGRRVAINPMPVHDGRFWPVADDQRYRAFVQQLALFTQRLLRTGREVFFFTTHFADARVALDVNHAVRTQAPELADRLPRIHAPTTVAELMKVISSADVVVATRFHGILLSLLAGRPVVGICYHEKSRELMTKYEQQRYAIDLEQIAEPALSERLSDLEACYAKEAGRIRQGNLLLQAQLEAQYREVFGRIARRRSR